MLQVLVVEDDDVIQRRWRKVMEQEGWTVHSATGVRQAEVLLQESAIPSMDAILLDIASLATTDL